MPAILDSGKENRPSKQTERNRPNSRPPNVGKMALRPLDFACLAHFSPGHAQWGRMSMWKPLVWCVANPACHSEASFHAMTEPFAVAISSRVTSGGPPSSAWTS